MVGLGARPTPTPFITEHAAIPSLKIEPPAGPKDEKATQFIDSVRYDPEMETNFGRRQWRDRFSQALVEMSDGTTEMNEARRKAQDL